MRVSHLFILASVLAGPLACTHAASPASGPTAAPPAVQYEVPDTDYPDEPDELAEPEPDPVAAAGPNAEVLVIEADDLGGDLGMIHAPPKRPSMPSFMSSISMAPNR